MIKKNIIVETIIFVTIIFLVLYLYGIPGFTKSCSTCQLYQVGDLIPARVIKIVDGDTIYVKIINRTYKVRLIGVNTPEIEHKNLHIQEQPGGKTAKWFTWFWLHDRNVWLELDLQWFDKYGRLLAYIWLKPFKTATYQDILNYQFNAILLINKQAKIMRVRPNIKYHKVYLQIRKEVK